ncbi:TRAP transporter small permease [Rhodoplanes sp. Z2-YC6860]|uniref:TRAP transporter small permease n=1 Tax=Rhodoplanes sp. Z2-YC6860 TaxID=674703 RepID=UPI00078C0F4A|nr:TRAP transporter small permease [Rhodoplanes sp. Z2-YC6860]AMN38740.1 TRAP dicarboxylate transporter subunit DctQ [Rhodoplanes sp. Z2-YC6860]
MANGTGPAGLIERLQRVQLRLASLALVALMLVTVFDVLLRYLFNKPIRGSYDIVECMLLIFIFHGMAAAFFSRRNITIDIIDGFIPPRVVAALIRLADVLSIVVLVLIFWAMITPATQIYQYGDVKLDSQIPIWWMWVAAFLGLFGTILAALAALLARPATPETERVE